MMFVRSVFARTRKASCVTFLPNGSILIALTWRFGNILNEVLLTNNGSVMAIAAGPLISRIQFLICPPQFTTMLERMKESLLFALQLDIHAVLSMAFLSAYC